MDGLTVSLTQLTASPCMHTCLVYANILVVLDLKKLVRFQHFATRSVA